MELINKFLAKTEFTNYEDFKQNYKVIVPDNFNFARDVVDFWAENEPQKTALIYCNDFNEEKIFSFLDVSNYSKKIATYLLQNGVKKGDRVMALLRRRYEYWMLAVACHRIGAVIVPVSIQMETNDLIYRVNASKAKMIIAINDSFVIENLKGLNNENCPTLIKIATVGGKTEYEDFNKYLNCELYNGSIDTINTDDMIVYFTSGTTSHPKQTLHTQLYPLGHIITAKYLHQVENNGLHITQADSGWAKFGWGNIYGQWIAGTAILGYDTLRFKSNNFIELLKKYRPTTVCLPPTMYRMLIRDGLNNDAVKYTKNFTSAGEQMPKELNETFYRISGKYIREGFGQSEGTPIFANWKCINVKLGFMGKPSPQLDIKLIDKKGNVCNMGEKGEIVIGKSDVALFKGYIYNKTFQSAYEDGIYHTNDICYLDEEGYGKYIGRKDDIIKCSGYRISPYEIESVLATHNAIKECAITGYPDKLREQIVCAVVVLKDGYNKDEQMIKELQEHVKQNTAPYKYPRKIIFTDNIKKTTSGKIERKALKEFAEQH